MVLALFSVFFDILRGFRCNLFLCVHLILLLLQLDIIFVLNSVLGQTLSRCYSALSLTREREREGEREK